MSRLLTKTTKMPGASFSLPAVTTCPTGCTLRALPNSVCSVCYAKKGRYIQDNVKHAQFERLALTKTDAFVPEMVAALHREARCGRPHFRWHDAGDIYSAEYFRKMLDIARQTPEVSHRIHTKEVAIVEEVLQDVVLPANVNLRISGYFINERPQFMPAGCLGCMTYTGVPDADVFRCPATETRKTCEDCRACWDQSVALVGYKKH